MQSQADNQKKLDEVCAEQEAAEKYDRELAERIEVFKLKLKICRLSIIVKRIWMFGDVVNVLRFFSSSPRVLFS